MPFKRPKRYILVNSLPLLYFLIIFIFSDCGILFAEGAVGANAKGRVYHVDFNYAGIERGTRTRPFRSLSMAVSAAACGDKIQIKTGTYHIGADRIKDLEIRNFRPEGPCEANADSSMLTITVDPASPGQVVLFAEGDLGDRAFLNIIDSRCVRLDGDNRLVIDGSSAIFDPVASLVNLYAYQKSIDHVVVENIEVCHTNGRGIGFRQAIGADRGDIVIRNNRLHDISQRAIGGYGNTVSIEGNEIWRAAMANADQAFGSGGWPGVIQTVIPFDESTHRYHCSQSIFIRDNVIRDCWGEGIIIGGSVGAEVSANRISDVFSVYIYVVMSRNVHITKNLLLRTTDRYDRKDKRFSAANGITFASELYEWNVSQTPSMIEDLLISGNRIENLGKGVSYWHDTSNPYPTNSYAGVFIVGNVLKGIHYAPFRMDGVPREGIAPSGCRISDNVIMDSGRPGVLADAFGNAEGWVFSNNRWIGREVND